MGNSWVSAPDGSCFTCNMCNASGSEVVLPPVEPPVEDDLARTRDIDTKKKVIDQDIDTNMLGVVHTVQIFPNGQKIAVVAGPEKTGRLITIFAYPSGQQLLVIDAHNGFNQQVRSIAIFPDGLKLASAASDGTARIFDAGTGKELKKIQHRDDEEVMCVAIFPDGKRLATIADKEYYQRTSHTYGNPYKRCYVWNAATGKEAQKPIFLENGRLCENFGGLAIFPDGSKIATTDFNEKTRTCTIRVWGKGDWPQDDPDSLTVEYKRTKSSCFYWFLAIFPCGKKIAAASEQPNEVHIFDVTGKRVSSPTAGKMLLRLQGHTNAVCCVNIFPNGEKVATSSNDKTCRIWDATSGKELEQIEDSGDPTRQGYGGVAIFNYGGVPTIARWSHAAVVRVRCLS